MKVGLAIGRQFDGRAEKVLNTLCDSGYKPSFILVCFPDTKSVLSHEKFNLIIRIFAVIALIVFPPKILT